MKQSVKVFDNPSFVNTLEIWEQTDFDLYFFLQIRIQDSSIADPTDPDPKHTFS